MLTKLENIQLDLSQKDPEMNVNLTIQGILVQQLSLLKQAIGHRSMQPQQPDEEPDFSASIQQLINTTYEHQIILFQHS